MSCAADGCRQEVAATVLQDPAARSGLAGQAVATAVDSPQTGLVARTTDPGAPICRANHGVSGGGHGNNSVLSGGGKAQARSEPTLPVVPPAAGG